MAQPQGAAFNTFRRGKTHPGAALLCPFQLVTDGLGVLSGLVISVPDGLYRTTDSRSGYPLSVVDASDSHTDDAVPGYGRLSRECAGGNGPVRLNVVSPGDPVILART